MSGLAGGAQGGQFIVGQIAETLDRNVGGRTRDPDDFGS